MKAIQTLTTAELENFVRDYGRGMPNPRLNEFERSAILKGIAAEIAQRITEAKALREAA